MRISEICIKRPVFATVMSLMVILVGIIAFLRLDVREYPNIDQPVITVTVAYSGASPEIIESEVTNVLEDALVGINGIESIESSNSEGSSSVSIQFTLETDLEIAANDVRDKVDRIAGRLPKDAESPIVSKAEADADPIMYLSISSDKHDALELSRYAELYIKDKIQTISGVAQVMIFGERRYAMKVMPDVQKMAAYKITISDIQRAIIAQNAEFPTGRIEGKSREFTVFTKSDLRNVDDFKNIVLRNNGAYVLRLGEIADIQIGAETERFSAKFNGKDAVAMGIVKQSNANPIDISNLIKKQLPAIEDSLPEGIKISIPYDKTVFIEASVKAVYSTIAEALVLVVLIILFFLRSYRSMIIPTIAIPISLIGAFILMQLFGFSINSLTLLALVLSIGLVVDDAIVVIENIYRYIERGMDPMKAAFKGANEIGFAIVAMTLTLAAVFLPIGFMQGQTGKLFTEFAWTLAMAVIVSGFVALTLSPMMCSRLLKHSVKHGKVYYMIEDFMMEINRFYREKLDIVLTKGRGVFLTLIATSLVGAVFFFITPQELAPTEDRGVILTIFNADEGATLDYTMKYSKAVEKVFNGVDEIKDYFMVIGFGQVNKGIAFAVLKDWKERKRSQMDIVNGMIPQMLGIHAIFAFPINMNALGGGGRDKALNFVLQTNQDYDKLAQMSDDFVKKLGDYPWLTNIETDMKLNQPRLEVFIDRDKAAASNVPLDQIGSTLQVLIGGDSNNNFKIGSKQYKVLLQLDKKDRIEPKDLESLYVRSIDGKMVKLSTLVTVKELVAPIELHHYNRFRSVKISANLATGHTLGEAISAVETVADEVIKPGEGKYEFIGQADQLLESSASTIITFGLALIFIYLVLAAQFESFKDPLIIMLSVPLSITGALITLYLSGGTLNIYSRIGLVTLIGLITKNGILIVEFTNQLMEEGKEALEAVKQASILRLRPILMTTSATVLGALPLALAAGPGAIARNNIGWIIIGGLVIGTLFTIFVIPTICYVMKKDEKRHIVKLDPKEEPLI